MKKYTSVHSFADAIINQLSDECFNYLSETPEFAEPTEEIIGDVYDMWEDEPIPDEVIERLIIDIEDEYSYSR